MAHASTAEAEIRHRRESLSPREAETDAQSYLRRPGWVRVLRYLLFACGGLALLAGGLAYWLSGGRYVETSDAYVQTNVLDVSTDVSGIVERILVHEGEHVQQGQVLFRLDPTKFQLAVDQAKANLAQTELALKSQQADYVSAERKVAAQQARADADEATFARYARLVKSGGVTRQQFDDAKYELQAAKAALGANRADATAALARLGGAADQPVTAMPDYKLAAAKLGEAEREARHAVVRAPFAGVVTQVSKLQPGQFLPAGTAAFGLVDTQGMWVAAQPKETALTYARPGDPATVTIDAYPGHVWHGTLQSVAPATDQEFAVLPAQNSSGNWVKVVQRVPLRVVIHAGPHDPPLSAGMSAEVSIDTHHHRSLSDLF